MKKKILTVFALLFLLLCACAQTEKELTFEEKMKLPGGTSDTSYVLRDPSIKTFADYEQKSLIEPNADYAVALVRCDDVTHYIFNRWPGTSISFATGNTVTITKLIKTGGPGNLFEENMQIEFMQQYGYRPGEDSESLKDYLDQELGLTSKEFLAKGVGFRHPVDLTQDYDYHLFSTSSGTVPLDEGEEYLILFKTEIAFPSTYKIREYYTPFICPLNTSKYQAVLQGAYGFSYDDDKLTMMKDFWNTFMEE